jgi:hypothetical protein
LPGLCQSRSGADGADDDDRNQKLFHTRHYSSGDFDHEFSHPHIVILIVHTESNHMLAG